jgi:hypothetical protein
MDMADRILDWLLEEDDPAARRQALTGLLGAPEDDPRVRKAQAALMKRGPAAEILARQEADGSWGDPSRFYRDKYGGTVWNLLILAELGADPSDARVRKSVEFLLANSRDPESGGFSTERSAKTGMGLPSGVIPCLTGNMVWAMSQLGFADDPRVRRAFDWIVRWQRADDGEDWDHEGPVYERFEMCFGRHTCHMGAAKALKALAAIPPGKQSKGEKAKAAELVEYFLKHRIYKKSHDPSTVARPGWTRFGFPLMYQTDVLELAGIFADLGVRDPRLDDAIALIRSKRTKDGSWLLENTFNGKTSVGIEAKGKPSKWITLRALRALKAYG